MIRLAKRMVSVMASGRFVEKLRHVVRRFQMPFGIGFEKAARRVQGDMLADAGDDVLQFAPFGRVIEHVIGGEQRHSGGARHALPFAQAAAVIALMGHGDAEPKPAGCGGEKLFQKKPDFFGAHLRRIGMYFFREFAHLLIFPGKVFVPEILGGLIHPLLLVRTRRHQHQQQAFLPFEEIVEREMAFALGGAQFSRTQQPAEAAIGGAVGGVSENVGRAVNEDKARANQQFWPVFFDCLQRRIGAHDTGQGVAVGNADGGKPALCRRFHKLPGMRGAAQEGIIRRHGDFGIGIHAKTPCRNHCGGTPAR